LAFYFLLFNFAFSKEFMVNEFLERDAEEELSLLETLDHVLDRGLVIAGEITISVANIDLIYLGLNVLLGSVESVNKVLGAREQRLELLVGASKEGREPQR
jgi:hypothetical protein